MKRMDRLFPPRQFDRALLVFVSIVLAAMPGFAGSVIGGTWEAQGPGPSTLGQVEGIADREVVGAIQTVVAHPTNADILYAGAVNGGVWKTMDATSASPTWTLQSGDLGSLSIGTLDLDPTDASHQTLVAGVGRYSSFGRIGGDRIGLLRTTDGGATWTEVADGGFFTGSNIYGVAARGATIIVTVESADAGANGDGLYRSTDTGATWTQISDGDGSTTGLPAGSYFDVAGNRLGTNRLFTAVFGAEANGGVSGLYRSTDTGATWTKISDAAIDTALTTGTVSNFEIAVGNGPNVNLFFGLVKSGRLSNVFRSTNNGVTWAAMDLPSDGVVGIHPGGQGSIHFSMVADPSDQNVVYMGGDRQDFPNGVGAADFSGRLFRGDASQPPGSQWVHLTHRDDLGPAGGGTANNSSPHADSRDMAIDANGELIETDDGGIYRRTSPQDNTGDWFSINGTIRTAEAHDSSYDANSDIILAGFQDTGSAAQIVSGGLRWRSVQTADGGDVAVDDISTPGFSTRFTSFQNLGSFRRQVFDAANAFQSQSFPALMVIGGGAVLDRQFVTPIKVHALDGDRMVIGGDNGVYESFDQATTITQLSPTTIDVNSGSSQPLLYGAADNPELIWTADGNTLWVRTAAAPAPLTSPASYPGTETVRDIAIDPADSSIVFVVDSDTVYRSTDGGASWTEIGAGIAAFDPGFLRSIAYLEAPVGDGIAVGTSKGVVAALESDGFATWQTLGSDFPTVGVFDLDYHPTTDLLVAGTMGNGAFRLTPTLVSSGPIFVDGFESGDTSAWSVTIGGDAQP